MHASSPLSPDAFDLLSDETRVRILRELAAADGPLAFTELRERIGVRDSGRFNYHLNRLCGRLVERADPGYALTTDGRRAARLL